MLQHPLRTPHLPTLHPRSRHPTRQRQSLERALRPMMIVIPPQHINMTSHPRGHRPTAQTMMNHLGIQPTHHRPPKPKFPHKKRPAADIHHGATERLVEGRIAVPEPGETGARAEGGFETGAESEEGVFGGMVIVDGEIAVAADEEGPAGVFGPGVEHMVQKADARPDPDVLAALELAGVVGVALRGDSGLAGFEDGGLGREMRERSTVEGERDLDVCLVGFTLLCGNPRGWRRSHGCWG